jgi:hypothetical protein
MQFMNKSSIGLALVSLTMLASCSSEIDAPIAVNGEVPVTLTAQLPDGIASRAFSDGNTVTNLHYAVYAHSDDSTQVSAPVHKDVTTISSGAATVQLNLVSGRTYDIVFWASANDSPYNYNDSTQCVTVNYDNAKANDEQRDAFYAVKTLTVSGAVNDKVSMVRPFAQINIGTSDLGSINDKTLTADQTAIKTKAYTGFNLRTGKVTGDETEVTFGFADIPTNEIFPYSGDSGSYDYLAMTYLLVPDEKQTVDVTLTVDSESNFKKTYANIPVQRNYRTNIFGALLTSPLSYSVNIEADYVSPDNNNYLWDGSTKAPAYDEASGSFLITGPAEFAYMIANSGIMPNSTVKKFTITADIDFNGKQLPNMAAWTWNIEVDGGGHTVSNFIAGSCASDATCYGLFANIVGSKIYNLTIDNAFVGVQQPAAGKDVYAGAVIGTGYGNTISKVTVQNSKVYGVNKVGGIIGFAAEYVTVTDCKVINTDIYGIGNDAGCVGGILGYNGINNGAETTLTNCTVSGVNISVPNGPTDNASRGNAYIVGTYDATVTLTNCTFSNSKIDSNTTWNDYVGSSRSNTPCTINGAQLTPTKPANS